MKNLPRLSFILFILASCAPASNPGVQPAISTETFAPTISIASKTPPPTLAPPVATFTLAPPVATFTPAPPTQTFTPLPPIETSTSTPPPFVESLKARVTADLLTCRYGPGSEYLYLFAFRKTTKIELIGQTGGNNWVLVQNSPQKCWVNAKFLEIDGDPKTLKVMYPEGYKLPVTKYLTLYGNPIVLSAVRDQADPTRVTVDWGEIRLRAGDEEDENMFIYIIEVWRCEGGQIIFDPLASNYPQITFVDEPGCSSASHGRVFFQEKHGYTGPSEIPWPAY